MRARKSLDFVIGETELKFGIGRAKFHNIMASAKKTLQKEFGSVALQIEGREPCVIESAVVFAVIN